MANGAFWYTFGVALFAAIGTFLFVSIFFFQRIGKHSLTFNRDLIPALPRLVCWMRLCKETFRSLTDRPAIAHPSWIAYMNHPSDGLTGAVGTPHYDMAERLTLAGGLCLHRRRSWRRSYADFCWRCLGPYSLHANDVSYCHSRNDRANRRRKH